MKRRALSLVAALVLVAPALANLLTNPGFEDGATGPIGNGVPGWNVWGNSGWHHDDAGRVIGTKAIKFWWDDAGIWQDFAVVAGQEYAFSVQALSAANDPLNLWKGQLKAEFYNSAIGTDPANALSATVIDRFYSATDPTEQWVTVGGSIVAPATADIGRIVLLIAEWQSGVSGALNFDEAAVTVVPEPAALGLLVLGLAATRRR